MTQQQKLKTWAFLLPLSAVLIWSLNMTVNRYVAEFISPVSISFYRWVIAILVLTPFVLPKAIAEWENIRPHLGKFAVLSAFGMLLYQGLAYSAAHFTSATHMGLINAFIPVFTILVGLIVLKIRPNQCATWGSLLSFLGLMIVVTQGDLQYLSSMGETYIGDLFMLLAVFFYACYGVYLKKWSLQVSLLVSLYVQICWALIFHVPLVLWQGLDALNGNNLASVIYAGLFPSIVAPLFWMMAVKQLGPNRSSVFMNLMPIFTACIAYLWLKEDWTIYHTLGTATILIGIFLAQYVPTTKNKSNI